MMPSSSLPLAFYVFAHACLCTAFSVLVFDPSLPGGVFYQPRFAALVHLLTLGWITGSILGSFYIVGPLALGMPLKTGFNDWMGFTAYVVGASALVLGFWSGRYDGVAAGGALATVSIAWVAARAFAGMRTSPAPWGVLLHVALAFVNMLGAALFGILVALDRSRGFLGWSPLGVTFAHVHIAAVGFATMMVVGLAYRLIPMMLPAAMPTGAGLATSAVLIEAGLLVLVVALLEGSMWTVAGWLLIFAGLVSFSRQMRGSVSRRMPRPPALPARDWSTWQAHAALLWLLLAVTVGGFLSAAQSTSARVPWMWVYGVAGLVGFLGQIITGIQGRLVPFYAWYRAFAAFGRPPATAANSLPSAAFAKTIFLAWLTGLPPLAVGLAWNRPPLVAGGSLVLAFGVLAGFVYLVHMLRAARRV